ncbi:uncharacterized protein [Procambarus clarkii]|uniref:uncharacterized protein isoform X2 n=1 Tax=Procambarus clarkii TaxID=6728 RepID=UPI003743FAE1
MKQRMPRITNIRDSRSFQISEILKRTPYRLGGSRCKSRPGTAVMEVESVYPRQPSPYLVLCCSSCESPPGGTLWCYPASEVAVEGSSYPGPTAGDD